MSVLHSASSSSAGRLQKGSGARAAGSTAFGAKVKSTVSFLRDKLEVRHLRVSLWPAWHVCHACATEGCDVLVLSLLCALQLLTPLPLLSPSLPCSPPAPHPPLQSVAEYYIKDVEVLGDCQAQKEALLSVAEAVVVLERSNVVMQQHVEQAVR